jgi:hypothetical protein
MDPFPFRPCAAPAPELVRTYGADARTEFEVIDHLGQLVAALADGSIGFEWYTAYSRVELARVGW